MKANNPLISREGFDFLFKLLQSNVSKENLEQILSSAITSADLIPPKISGESVRKLKKFYQFQGIINLVNKLGLYDSITEVASGNGKLGSLLAKSNSQANIFCLEKNPLLVSNCRQEYSLQENLHFSEVDAFETISLSGRGLVLSLHGCGNLTDCVSDLAVQSGSDVLCVPCCYALINHASLNRRLYHFPRSKSLEYASQLFVEIILPNVAKVEGVKNDQTKDRSYFVQQLYRLLFDLDRALYLKENGYFVSFVDIVPENFNSDGKKYKNTPLRRAIVGRVN